MTIGASSSLRRSLERLIEAICDNASELVLDDSYVREIGPYVNQATLVAPSAEELLERAYAEDAVELLDFGCGQMAHRPFIEGLGYRWHGVDYLAGMPTYVRERVDPEAGEVTFYDGKTLPFANGRFDRVWAMLVLHHVQHIDLTFSEIGRVLRPAGKVIGQVAYLEQVQDFSTFNYTPIGLKQAARQAGMRLLRIYPKHDAFFFLFRRLMITFGAPDENEFTAQLDPDGFFHHCVARAAQRLGASTLEVNLLRLLFCTHYVFELERLPERGGANQEAGPIEGPEDNEPLSLAEAGIAARDAGNHQDAERILTKLIREHAGLVYGWQELGELRQQQRRDEEALALFREACHVAPLDPLPRRRFLSVLAKLGKADSAIAELAAVGSRLPLDTTECRLYQELEAYIAAHSEAEIVSYFKHLRRRPGILNEEEVGRRIAAAVEGRQPCSLIRLGDGEGAWLSLSESDERRYPVLYEAMRREVLTVWFGDEGLYGAPGFMDLPRRFREVLSRADIIGIPLQSRIEGEFQLASQRGIPAIGNIFRFLRTLLGKEWRGSLCENDVHLDLHFGGILKQLLSLGHPVGLISCHPDLGFRLAASYRTHVVRQIVIPEEKGFSEMEGVSGMPSAHYPRVFYATMERLKAEAPEARLWLVAAGFLGKFYCDAIRAGGSVALDIGSVADGWAGKITRPTLVEIDRFTLAGRS